MKRNLANSSSLDFGGSLVPTITKQTIQGPSLPSFRPFTSRVSFFTGMFGPRKKVGQGSFWKARTRATHSNFKICTSKWSVGPLVISPRDSKKPWVDSCENREFSNLNCLAVTVVQFRHAS